MNKAIAALLREQHCSLCALIWQTTGLREHRPVAGKGRPRSRTTTGAEEAPAKKGPPHASERPAVRAFQVGHSERTRSWAARAHAKEAKPTRPHRRPLGAVTRFHEDAAAACLTKFNVTAGSCHLTKTYFYVRYDQTRLTPVTISLAFTYANDQ